MPNNAIAYETVPGGICDLITPDMAKKTASQTADQYLNAIVAIQITNGQSYKLFDMAVLPSDDAFRLSWRLDATVGIKENLIAAKIEIVDKIRAVRPTAFKDIDRRRSIALGIGALQAPIESDAQILRDLTIDPAITAATDMTMLRATWKTSLLGSIVVNND